LRSQGPEPCASAIPPLSREETGLSGASRQIKTIRGRVVGQFDFLALSTRSTSDKSA
jgi:hypothetical protein